MEQSDDVEFGLGVAVNDAVGIFVNLTQWLIGVLMDAVSLPWRGGGFLHALDQFCDHAIGVERRILRYVAMDGAKRFTGFGGPSYFHVRPNSLRMEA